MGLPSKASPSLFVPDVASAIPTRKIRSANEVGDCRLPKIVNLGSYHLEILSPKYAEEDYAAVTESTTVLIGLFRDAWPKGITYRENLSDLRRHQDEFDRDEAYSWVVRSTATDEYLGCAYYRPDKLPQNLSHVYTWVRDRPDRIDLLEDFNRRFRAWLTSRLPNNCPILWRTNDWVISISNNNFAA